MHRRKFLHNAGRFAGIGFVGQSLMSGSMARSARLPDRIKVGQIGTTHAHAVGKMAALRKLSEVYEVVGIVEPDADLAKERRNIPE